MLLTSFPRQPTALVKAESPPDKTDFACSAAAFSSGMAACHAGEAVPRNVLSAKSTA